MQTRTHREMRRLAITDRALHSLAAHGLGAMNPAIKALIPDSVTRFSGPPMPAGSGQCEALALRGSC